MEAESERFKVGSRSAGAIKFRFKAVDRCRLRDRALAPDFGLTGEGPSALKPAHSWRRFIACRKSHTQPDLPRLSGGLQCYWRPPRRPTPIPRVHSSERIIGLFGKFPVHGGLAPQRVGPIMHTEYSTVALSLERRIFEVDLGSRSARTTKLIFSAMRSAARNGY